MNKQTGSYLKHTSTFDYPIASDPNYITDQEFFGVWNNSTKTWEAVPYFLYEKYPDMAQMEAAAKEGNYEIAKRRLYEYYLPRRDKYTTRVTSASKTDIVCAELMARNVYALSQMNGCPIEIFTVGNCWKDISIDVLDSVNKAAGTEIYVSFVIASIDKTDSHAEFYANESGYPPALSLVVNDNHVEIPAAKDTYIRAGSYSDVNFGNENIMKVQESGTYQNFNSNTQRAYISFNISGLSSSDDISSATFNIKGINAGGNGEKELFLYWWGNSAWEEGTLVWNTFSDHLLFSCNDEDCWDYITSCKPSVKGKVCFFHRGNEQAKVAALYDYTKDEKYAYTFIRQIMGLISNVKVDKSVMNELDISRFVSNINNGFIHC